MILAIPVLLLKSSEPGWLSKLYENHCHECMYFNLVIAIIRLDLKYITTSMPSDPLQSPHHHHITSFFSMIDIYFI